MADLWITIGGVVLFIVGFVLGKLDRHNLDWKDKERPPLYFWDCPVKGCIYHIEMEDKDAAEKRVEAHTKRVHGS